MNCERVAYCGPEEFQCDICDKKFAKKRFLEQHITVTHFGIKKHECQHCNKKFGTKANMQRHLPICHPNGKKLQPKLFKCFVCQTSFRGKKLLSAHKTTHHKCNVCDRIFVDKTNLHRHMQLDHECSVCDKTFRAKGSLQRHIAIKHLGINKHECTHCNVKFATKANMERHILKLHPEDEEIRAKSIRCSVCGSFFQSKILYSRHMTEHCINKNKVDKFDSNNTEGPEISNLKQINSSEERPKHLLTVASDKNGVALEPNIETVDIVIVEGKRRYKCDICGQTLYKFSALRNHMSRHNNIKPYKCPSCDKHFKKLSDMRRHLNIAHEIKCKSNVNTTLWNAINNPNSDLIKSITNEHNKRKKQPKDNTHKLSDSCADKTERLLPILENLHVLENVKKLSMPILDDELETVAERNETTSTKDLLTNSEHEKSLNKVVCEKTAPLKTINRKNNKCDFESTSDRILPQKSSSISLLRDSLIGQSNVPLIEKLKDESAKAGVNKEVANHSSGDLLPQDVIYVPMDQTSEDNIICSEWKMFDNDIINLECSASCDASTENAKVAPGNMMYIPDIYNPESIVQRENKQYTSEIDSIVDDQVHARVSDSQYNAVKHNQQNELLASIPFKKEYNLTAHKNIQKVSQDVVDIDSNERDNLIVPFNINGLSLESNNGDFSITDIVEAIASDAPFCESAKNVSPQLYEVNEITQPLTEKILNCNEGEKPCIIIKTTNTTDKILATNISGEAHITEENMISQRERKPLSRFNKKTTENYNTDNTNTINIYDHSLESKNVDFSIHDIVEVIGFNTQNYVSALNDSSQINRNEVNQLQTHESMLDLNQTKKLYTTVKTSNINSIPGEDYVTEENMNTSCVLVPCESNRNITEKCHSLEPKNVESQSYAIIKSTNIANTIAATGISVDNQNSDKFINSQCLINSSSNINNTGNYQNNASDVLFELNNANNSIPGIVAVSNTSESMQLINEMYQLRTDATIMNLNESQNEFTTIKTTNIANTFLTKSIPEGMYITEENKDSQCTLIPLNESNKNCRDDYENAVRDNVTEEKNLTLSLPEDLDVKKIISCFMDKMNTENNEVESVDKDQSVLPLDAENNTFACPYQVDSIHQNYLETAINPHIMTVNQKENADITQKIYADSVNNDSINSTDSKIRSDVNITTKTPNNNMDCISKSILKSLKYLRCDYQYKCENCAATFIRAFELRRHQKTHNSSRPIFICDQCGKCLTSKSAMSIHLKYHDSTDVLCWLCGVMLKEISFERHKCVSPYRYHCAICKETFLDGTSKNRHLLQHLKHNIGKTSPPSPHRKTLNEGVDENRIRLKNKVKICKTAREPKIYACEICCQEFKNNKSNLIMHMRNVHNENRGSDYKCECGATYLSKASLLFHQRKDDMKQHKCPYICRHCSKFHPSRKLLIEHLKKYSNHDGLILRTEAATTGVSAESHTYQKPDCSFIIGNTT